MRGGVSSGVFAVLVLAFSSGAASARAQDWYYVIGVEDAAGRSARAAASALEPSARELTQCGARQPTGLEALAGVIATLGVARDGHVTAVVFSAPADEADARWIACASAVLQRAIFAPARRETTIHARLDVRNPTLDTMVEMENLEARPPRLPRGGRVAAAQPPQPPRPVVRVVYPEGLSVPDGGLIRQAMRAHQADFDTCYARGRRTAPALEGEAVFEVELSANGHFRARLVRSTLGDRVGACLVRSLEALTIPPPDAPEDDAFSTELHLSLVPR